MNLPTLRASIRLCKPWRKRKSPDKLTLQNNGKQNCYKLWSKYPLSGKIDVPPYRYLSASYFSSQTGISIPKFHSQKLKRRGITANISFEAIKNAVDVRTAVEVYGLSVHKNGMVCCPFHDDNHPSMRIYDNHHTDSRFICFGCGEAGDVIDFTAKLFGISKYEAARKITQDFGLTGNTTEKTSVLAKLRYSPDHRNHTLRILTDYIKMLEEWRNVYKPSDTDDELKPQFLTALHELSRLQYYQDIFLSGTREEQIQITKNLQEDIPTFEKEIHRYRHHPFPGHKSADAALG